MVLTTVNKKKCGKVWKTVEITHHHTTTLLYSVVWWKCGVVKQSVEKVWKMKRKEGLDHG
jgi:hypothetical protein